MTVHGPDEIARAIRDRKLLSIRYGSGQRLVEPHAYGRSLSGHLLLRAFQVSGASTSGVSYGWKLLRIDELGFIQVCAETFPGPRPGYRRGDSHMKGGIIAQL